MSRLFMLLPPPVGTDSPERLLAIPVPADADRESGVQYRPRRLMVSRTFSAPAPRRGVDVCDVPPVVRSVVRPEPKRESPQFAALATIVALVATALGAIISGSLWGWP